MWMAALIKIIKAAKRRSNFEYYKNAFKDVEGISLPCELQDSCSNRWLTCILLGDDIDILPSGIIEALEEEQIEARRLWKPMQEQPLFKDYPYYGDGLSERLFQSGLCLPSGSQLTEADLQRIAQLIINLVN